MQGKIYISISFCSSSQYISFPPIFSKVAHPHFQGLGWERRHFPVLILGFPCNFGVKKPKGQLKVTQGSTGVKLPYLGSESHGVLTTKFNSYPINTSQVIPFLRSIITFSGKRLLTPEGVTGGLGLNMGKNPVHTEDCGTIDPSTHEPIKVECARPNELFFELFTLSAHRETRRFHSAPENCKITTAETAVAISIVLFLTL